MRLPSNSSKYILEFFDRDKARRIFAVPREYILGNENGYTIDNLMSDIPFWAVSVHSLETLDEVESYLENIAKDIPFSIYGIQNGGFHFPRTVEDFLIYTGLRNNYLKPLEKEDPRAEFEDLTGEIKELPHKLETIRDFYSGFTEKIDGKYLIAKLPIVLNLNGREFIPGFIGVNHYQY